MMDVVYAAYPGEVQTPDGARILVRGGTHWLASDPVVKSAPPGMFSADPRAGLCGYGPPPPDLAWPPVEQATAAPGEKRPVGRPRVNRNA